VHGGQVAPQREPRGKHPVAEAAGTGPEVLIVKALLVVHERHTILELFAAEVAGRYNGRLALVEGGWMAGDGVPSERVHIAQLVTADVTHAVRHAFMHLLTAEKKLYYFMLANSRDNPMYSIGQPWIRIDSTKVSEDN
jgi:hypothetical protein